MTLQELKQSKEFKDLEEMDKKLRHEPVTLYCLGCGKIINSNFTGGLWSYTHPCNYEEIKRNWDKEDTKYISCVVFGSKERGVMLPSSIICGYKSHSRCKECKSEEEHIRKVLEGCGLLQEFKSEDLELKKLRAEAIIRITKCCSGNYTIEGTEVKE